MADTILPDDEAADKAAKRRAYQAAHTKKRWDKDPEAARAALRAYRAANREKVKAWEKASRERNREKIAACKAAYRARDPEKYRKKVADWVKENPDAARTNRHQRRAREWNASGDHTPRDIAEIKAQQKHKCAYCKKRLGKKYAVDHIIPLKLGGGNERRNLQILCSPCNMAKSAKHPVHYAQEIGLLI